MSLPAAYPWRLNETADPLPRHARFGHDRAAARLRRSSRWDFDLTIARGELVETGTRHPHARRPGGPRTSGPGIYMAAAHRDVAVVATAHAEQG